MHKQRLFRHALALPLVTWILFAAGPSRAADEAAGPAAMMRNLDILFAYIYQVALLGQPANGLSILGACFVVTCAVIIGTRKWLSTKRRA